MVAQQAMQPPADGVTSGPEPRGMARFSTGSSSIGRSSIGRSSASLQASSWMSSSSSRANGSQGIGRISALSSRSSLEAPADGKLLYQP